MTAPDLSALLARVWELDKASSPGPWINNGYSRIDAEPLLQVEEDWTGPISRPNDRGGYAHTYYEEALALVAHVPAEYGDTATGRHQADLRFIAESRTLLVQLAEAAQRLQGLLSDMTAHHNGIEWAGDKWGDDCCLDCGHLRRGEDERSLAAAYKHQAHPPLTHKPDCKWAELSRRLSEFAAPSRPDTET